MRNLLTAVQFYTPEELTAIEAGADQVNSRAHANLLPPECFHVTQGKCGSPKRTKFFFGARYLWTREQMTNAATARRAHGVRVDVPAPPSWMQVSIQMLYQFLMPSQCEKNIKYLPGYLDRKSCSSCSSVHGLLHQLQLCV